MRNYEKSKTLLRSENKRTVIKKIDIAFKANMVQHRARKKKKVSVFPVIPRIISTTFAPRQCLKIDD